MSTATLEFTVTEADTAATVGSGSLEVLGTPRLLAWCEAATCAAVADELESGETTVGTRVSVEHTRASAVGRTVSVTASVAHRDGRLYRFTVAAHHAEVAGGAQELIGSGEITRVRVDADRFMTKVSAPPGGG